MGAGPCAEGWSGSCTSCLEGRKENNAGEEAFLAGISWEVALGFDPPGTWLAKACSDRDSKFPVSFYAGTHTSLMLEAASPTSTSGRVHTTREGQQRVSFA